MRIFASSRLKENEAGIKGAARSLRRELVFLDDEAINAYDPLSRSEENRFDRATVVFAPILKSDVSGLRALYDGVSPHIPRPWLGIH